MGETEEKLSIKEKIKGMGDNIKSKAANEALKNIKIDGKPLSQFVNEFFIRLKNIEKIQIAIAASVGGASVEYDKNGNITAATVNGKKIEFV